MAVGVHRRLASQRRACQLRTSLRDHFIHVHVELRSAAGHPDMQRKIIFVEAVEDLIAGLNNKSMRLVRQASSRVVHAGRRLLERCVRRDHLPRNEVLADAKVFERSLRLRAPQHLRGNLNFAEAVGFFSHVGRLDFIEGRHCKVPFASIRLRA